MPSRLDYLGYDIKPDGTLSKEHVVLAAPEDIGPGRYDGASMFMTKHTCT